METLTLDGLALNGGGPFWLEELAFPPPKQRAEWVGSADSESQALLRTPMHENRKVTCKLWIHPQASKDAALNAIADLSDKLQEASAARDGIALVWGPAGSTRQTTFDVIGGEIVDMPIDMLWAASNAPHVTVEMTCLPYGRETEVLTSVVTAGASPVTTIDVAGVPGDAPALARLIVTNDFTTASMAWLEWGAEQRGHDPIAPEPLVITSDQMVTAGYAGAIESLGGSYSTNVIAANVLSRPVSLGVLSGDHVGAFRVHARVRADDGDVRFRLAWRVGNGPWVAHPYVTVTQGGQYASVDLGTIRVPRVREGSQEWQGRIDAYRPSATSRAYFDAAMLIPQDAGYGRARAPVTFGPQSALSAYDMFAGMGAVALDGRTAPVGGVWDSGGMAGDFFGLGLPGGNIVVERLMSGDTQPRWAALGSTSFTSSDQMAHFRLPQAIANQAGSNMRVGVIRRSAAGNAVVLDYNYVTGTLSLGTQNSAGVATYLAHAYVQVARPGYILLRLRAAASWAAGMIAEYSGTGDAPPLATVAATGSFPAGFPGFQDMFGDTLPGGYAYAIERYVDDFFVAALEEDAVALPLRRIQISSDGIPALRESSDTTLWGAPPIYRGDRFLLQPAGDRGLTTRVAVRAYRRDLETEPYPDVAHSLRVQVAYTPRVLSVPR